MPLFKVKPDCQYRVLIKGTNVTRFVYVPGDVLELENIDEGEQACRLEALSEDEELAYLEKKEAEEKSKLAEEGLQKEEQKPLKNETLGSKEGNLQNAKAALSKKG